MSKRNCCNCDKLVTVFNPGRLVYDGQVCNKCLSYGQIPELVNNMVYDGASMRECIKQRAEMAHLYRVTHMIEQEMEIDEANRIVRISGEMFSFDNIAAYDFREDIENIGHQAGGAAAGGVAGAGLGAATNSESVSKVAKGGIIGANLGALTGAAIGAMLRTDICHSMVLEILLRDTYRNSITIVLIDKDVKVHSDGYRKAKASVKKYTAALQAIGCLNSKPFGDNDLPEAPRADKIVTDTVKAISAASGKLLENIGKGLSGTQADRISKELSKYKKMVEQGLITSDEYDQKKHEILTNEN